MAKEESIQARIERLLDQLENPHLRKEQIDTIERKIKILQEVQSRDNGRTED